MADLTRTGRPVKRLRTRAGILAAARRLVDAGDELTMPAVAAAAEISEATAYRHFPTLRTLLQAVVSDLWPGADGILEPVAASRDPVERVACATEAVMRHALRYERTIRASTTAAVGRVDAVGPDDRAAIIAATLAPVDGVEPATMAQLERSLAVVLSSDALLTLVDFDGIPADEAIASIVATAVLLTRATLDV